MVAAAPWPAEACPESDDMRPRAAAWMIIYCHLAMFTAACSTTSDATLMELQRVKSGQFDVVLLSSHDAIKHSRDSFVLEFRAPDGALVDVGDVKGSATMPMPGTPMFGSLEIKKTAVHGRYLVDGRFDMAGTWRTTVQWQGTGASGSGSVTVSTNVQ